MTANDWADLILYAATPFWILTAIGYAFVTRGRRRSEVGWNVLLTTAFTGLFLLFASTGVSDLVDLKENAWIRVVVYGVGLPLGIWRFSVLARSILKGIRTRRALRTHPLPTQKENTNDEVR